MTPRSSRKQCAEALLMLCLRSGFYRNGWSIKHVSGGWVVCYYSPGVNACYWHSHTLVELHTKIVNAKQLPM